MDKRKPIKNTLIVTNLEVADSKLLSASTSTLNRSELSGKRAGSIVATYDQTSRQYYLSVAQGPAPTDPWVTIGAAGGGGGGAGEVDVAHRVRMFALSSKEAVGKEFKTTMSGMVTGDEKVIGLGGLTGLISNLKLDKTGHTLTFPKMVTGFLTYNGVVQVDAVIDGTTAGESTWVKLEARYYVRPVGSPWPSAPSIVEAVDVRTGSMGNAQFYTKKQVFANMASEQEVQLRFAITSLPAGVTGDKISFGKDGWGTSFNLTSGQISNPDMIEF